MKGLQLWMPWALGYAACMALSHVLLKLVGQSTPMKGLTVFALANGVGFLGMALLPFALKKGPTSFVYALAIGGGFALLQTACWILFPQPASLREIGGVCLIVAGLCLLASCQMNA
jgi:multidrug transporter EmrE-like cation transporter